MKNENDNKTKAGPAGPDSGMTLLEVLIASTLGVLLIAGIFAALLNADKGACMGAQYVAAFGRARELVEQMRGSPYANVTSSNYPYETNLVLTDIVGSQLVQLYCTRTNTIAAVANPQGLDVTVTVQWTFRNKTNIQSAYTTIYNQSQ